METKIQLSHPTGKKVVAMDKDKYDILKKCILDCLKRDGVSTHVELLAAINEDFRKNKITFEGSVEWYMEWVKLDLEARNKIKRTGDKSPVKFMVTG